MYSFYKLFLFFLVLGSYIINSTCLCDLRDSEKILASFHTFLLNNIDYSSDEDVDKYLKFEYKEDKTLKFTDGNKVLYEANDSTVTPYYCNITGYVHVTSGQDGAVFTTGVADNPSKVIGEGAEFWVITDTSPQCTGTAYPVGSVIMPLSPGNDEEFVVLPYGYYNDGGDHYYNVSVGYETIGEHKTDDKGGLILIANKSDANMSETTSWLATYLNANTTHPNAEAELYFGLLEQAGDGVALGKTDAFVFGLDTDGDEGFAIDDDLVFSDDEKIVYVYNYSLLPNLGKLEIEEGFISERGTKFVDIDTDTVKFAAAKRLANYSLHIVELETDNTYLIPAEETSFLYSLKEFDRSNYIEKHILLGEVSALSMGYPSLTTTVSLNLTYKISFSEPQPISPETKISLFGLDYRVLDYNNGDLLLANLFNFTDLDINQSVILGEQYLTVESFNSTHAIVRLSEVNGNLWKRYSLSLNEPHSLTYYCISHFLIYPTIHDSKLRIYFFNESLTLEDNSSTEEISLITINASDDSFSSISFFIFNISNSYSIQSGYSEDVIRQVSLVVTPFPLFSFVISDNPEQEGGSANLGGSGNENNGDSSSASFHSYSSSGGGGGYYYSNPQTSSEPSNFYKDGTEDNGETDDSGKNTHENSLPEKSFRGSGVSLEGKERVRIFRDFSRFDSSLVFYFLDNKNNPLVGTDVSILLPDGKIVKKTTDDSGSIKLKLSQKGVYSIVKVGDSEVSDNYASTFYFNPKDSSGNAEFSASEMGVSDSDRFFIISSVAVLSILLFSSAVFLFKFSH